MCMKRIVSLCHASRSQHPKYWMKNMQCIQHIDNGNVSNNGIIIIFSQLQHSIYYIWMHQWLCMSFIYVLYTEHRCNAQLWKRK